MSARNPRRPPTVNNHPKLDGLFKTLNDTLIGATCYFTAYCTENLSLQMEPDGYNDE